MTDAVFNERFAALNNIFYREEFETALYNLYQESMPTQAAIVRSAIASTAGQPRRPWKNPSDYDRSDLTPEQRLTQQLTAMSITDGGVDYRDA